VSNLVDRRGAHPLPWICGRRVKVVRSLDTKFGLDEQAIKATKQWTFKPATKDGKPVPCPVAIEQSFFLNSTK
jgi:Gram-negative bacterial TonB protein C-terminal